MNSVVYVVVRLIAFVTWRTPKQVAKRLRAFAATEQGSALDMLKAAELCDEPRLRRLFFRHALDEFRHAKMFDDAARRLDGAASLTEYALIHAKRQNLFERYSLQSFLAFVYLAERRAGVQFRALADHLSGPERKLLLSIGRDELRHVAYSRHELLKRAGGTRTQMVLTKVRLQLRWSAWKNQGRVIGDAVGMTLMLTLYWTVLPIFAIAIRLPNLFRRRGSVAPRAMNRGAA